MFCHLPFFALFLVTLLSSSFLAAPIAAEENSGLESVAAVDPGGVPKENEEAPASSSAAVAAPGTATEKLSFSVAEKLDVDPATGTAVTSIPIRGVPGRAGIEPALSLLYNSSGGNSIAGIGWSLEIGAIQRSTKRGIPQYSAADTFVLLQAGSRQELIDISGNATEYRPKIEGAFSKITYSGNVWTIFDKKGTKYFFGSTAAARTYDPQDAGRVFQWHLDRVEDMQGNYLSVSYERQGNQLLLSSVRYTGHAPTAQAPYAEITFIYEQRPDQIKNYLPGFFLSLDKRLQSIDVLAAGQRVRRYVLGYQQEAQTGQSVLSSFVELGSDNASALPEGKFIYSEPVINWSEALPLNQRPADALNSGLVHLVDMNADGLADLVKTFPGTNNPYQIYFNRSSEAILAFDSPVAAAHSPWYGTDNPDIRWLDFNADGLLDVIYGAGFPYTIWLNNGLNGFETAKTISQGPNISISHQNLVQFVDMNGDGFTDILETYSGNNQDYKVYLNMGTADFHSPFPAAHSPIRGMDNIDVQFGDFNGDGLLDVIYGAACPYTIWLNNGTDGYASPFAVSSCPEHSISHQGILRFVDMNGDGLTDLLDSYSGNNQNYQIYFNNGKGNFEPPVAAQNSPVRGLDNPHVKLMDMNADGLLDIIVGQVSAGLPYQVWLNNGQSGFQPPVALSAFPNADLDDPLQVLIDLNKDSRPDLLRGESGGYSLYRQVPSIASSRRAVLIQMDNSFGGQTEIAYQELPIKGLNGATYKSAHQTTLINTVSEVTLRSAFGDAYTSRYVLEEGLWNHREREFRGFKKVLLADPEGNYQELEYLQDDIFKGRLLNQKVFDRNGNLYAKTENTWLYDTLGPEWYFVFLGKKDDFVYDGNASGRRTQEQYFYGETPQLGNLTRIQQLGEVALSSGADVGSDGRTIETSYVSNIQGGQWLAGFPRETRLKNATGEIVSQAWFYYDGHDSVTAPPVKGLLTKKESWAGASAGAVNPVVQYTYDSYGNVLTSEDSEGGITTTSYDSGYHLFPLSVTNALGHAAANAYYGVNGVPLSGPEGSFGLWGQLRSSTDPNAQQALLVYDVFGRPLKSISPVDSPAQPTAATEIRFLNDHFEKVTSRRIVAGQPATLDTIEFYDGLGQLLQSKTKSEIPGRYVVQQQAERDARGLVVKQYLPFFSDASWETIVPVDGSRPHSQLLHDAVGRISRTTSPDGTYATFTYDDWKTETINENGHKKVSIGDAYGRLVVREEYTGSDGRSPHYPASPYTLYAATEYRYDAAGNLLEVEDALGHVSAITYDSLGRKKTLADPDMGWNEYTYDSVGNLIKQKDAAAQEIQFDYDALYRLKEKFDGLNLNVAYAYDSPTLNFSKGRLSQVDYKISENARFSYDALGREIAAFKTIDGYEYAMSRQYDNLNRLTKLVYPLGGELDYGYNAAGAIETVSGTFAESGSPSFPPVTPVLNSATAEIGKVVLNWNVSVRAEGYKVKYGTESGNYSMTLDVGNVTGHEISELTSGVTYFFVVTAHNIFGESAVSNERSAVPLAPAPAAPVLNSALGENQAVTLNWDAASGALGYKIHYGTASGSYGTTLDVGLATTRQIANLSNGVPYYFVVSAYNGTGESPYSNQISATPSAIVSGAIVFDSSGSFQIDDVTQTSFNYSVVTPQPNRILIIGLALKDGSSTPQANSVTYAGQNLTLMNRTSNTSLFNKFGVELWYLLNPPTGSAAVTAIFNTNVDGITIGAVSLSGVNQTAPEAANKASGNSSSAAVNVTTLSPGSWLVDCLVEESSSVSVTAASGQTQRFLEINSGDVVGAGSTKSTVTAGVTSMNWQWSSSRRWALAALALAPADALAAVKKEGSQNVLARPRLFPPASRSVWLEGQWDSSWDKWRKAFRQTFQIAISFFSEMLFGSEAYADTSFDFLTFIESDPDAEITRTAACITYANLETAVTNAYVYKNQTTSGNFTYEFDAVVTAADSFAGPLLLWGIGDKANATFDDWSDGIYVVFNKVGSTFRAELGGVGLASQLSANLIFGQRYYFTVSRSGNAVSAKVYSNANRSTLISTLNINEATTSFPYLYALSARTFIGTTKKATGDVCRLVDKLAQPPTAPVAPVLSSATAGNAQVALQWNAVSGASAYKVRYGTTSGSYSTTLDVGNITSKTMTGLLNGTTYYFVVTAYNAVGESSYSNEKNAVPQVPVPAAPILQAPVGSDAAIDLNWNAVAGAAGYKVKYGTVSGSYSTIVDAGNVTSFEVAGLQNFVTYYLVVSAYNAAGEGPPSNQVSATPEPPLPAAPVLDSAVAADAAVTLSWSAVSAASGYKIYYGTASAEYGTPLDVQNVTSTTINNLTNATTYYFAVVAYNPSGDSPLSNEKSTTPQASGPMVFIRNVDYSPAGQMTLIEYGNGDSTIYNYDALNLRLLQIKTTTAAGQIIQDLNYTYDSAGNIITIVDAVNNSTQNFQYDALGRLVEAAGPYGLKHYAYDPIGNLLEKDGVTYTYGQNGAGPHAVTSGSDGSSFAYDANGNMTRSVKDGIVWDYIYDAENRLAEIKKDSQTQSRFEYDGDGGRTQKTVYDYAGGVASRFLKGTRVAMADGTRKPIEDVEAGEWVLTFNPETRTTTTALVENVWRKKVSSLEFVALNARLRVSPSSLVYSRGQWQAAGELKENGALLNEHLSEEVLQNISPFSSDSAIEVFNLQLTAADTFFADGYLVKSVEVNPFLLERHRGYQNVLASLGGYAQKALGYLFSLPEAEAALGGTSRTTYFVGAVYEEEEGATTKHIFLGDRRVVSVDSGGVRYYHTDHLGGTHVVSDEAGSVRQILEYDPFGSVTRNEAFGAAISPATHLFTGQYWEPESGLYYYGARYYDPTIGRFLTADTMIPSPSDSQSFNRYSYVINNPVNLIDPTGHKWSWSKFWNSLAGGVVGGLVTAITGGAGASLSGAMFLGGLTGGAVSGGLEGNWNGALAGAGIGGLLGGGVGVGIESFGKGFGVGALMAGAGIAGATDSWDSFSGGLAGGYLGNSVGNGIDSYFHDGISNQNPNAGIRAGTDPRTNENWEVLGITTTDSKAALHAAENQTAVFYTRSRGALADFVRAGMQKVFGNSLASRQFVNYLSFASGKYIYAHSEGTLTVSGAAKALQVQGVFLSGAHLDWNAPVIFHSTAMNLSKAIGATFDYHLNWADPIGVLTTYNPVRVAIYGSVGTATLATMHSTAYYRNRIY